MADISRLLDTTIAGQIARKLDENDDCPGDGKIDKSIWNQFVNDIGTGKTIEDSISITNAMNSITTYAIRLAKQAGKTVDDLALEWLTKVGGAPQTRKPEDTQGTGDTGSTGSTGSSEGSRRTRRKPGEKYSTSDIKVSVPVKYISERAKSIIEAHKQGEQLHDSLKRGDTRGLTPENIASAFTADVNFGPNTKKQATTVLNLLVKRMKDLGLLNKDEEVTVTFNSYKELNKILHDFRNRIVAEENKIVRQAQKEKSNFNRDRSKIQSQLDNANQLLVDIANNPTKAKIIRGTNSDNQKWAKAELQTGEWITVIYDDQGEIDIIHISHDTTYDRTDDGKVFDGAEVCYTSQKAKISTERNGYYNYNILPKYYSFDKLKEIAEAIFGKAQ